MSNLVIRAITGFFFTLFIIVSILLGNDLQAIAFTIFLALGLKEYAALFKNTDYKQSQLITVFIGLTIYVLFVLSRNNIFTFELIFSFVFVLLFLVFLIEIWRKQNSPLLSLSVFVFGIIYLVVPFVLMNRLVHVNSKAFPPLLGMIIIIWTNDTFAYLIGRKIGKTPLFERISPKKTWEGTFGGIIMIIVSSVLIALYTNSDDTIFWLISGIIIAPCTIFGDLLESLFKRSMKIKDTGNILPGHGGILDRFDAVLFTVPFFYLWHLLYEQLV
jgi:phosphatidate cytidylyltransferase